MFRLISQNIIKWRHIRFFFTFLIIVTIIISCASREELLRESSQHYEFGLHYLEKGNLAQAYEEFENVKSISPEDDRAYFGLGLTLYFQGKYDLALLSYQKAIKLNPHAPEYYNNMAAVLGKLGRWNDVIQYCQVALDNPSYTTPGFAYYNMGCAYINLGKPQKAAEYLKKSKIENPTYIDTHLLLGKALFQLGNFQGAIENLKEAMNLEADAPFEDFSLQAEIEYFLGRSYLALEDISSAKNFFKSVIEKAPGSTWAEESSKCLKNLQYTKKTDS